MYLDEESFLYVYKSIVSPHFEYANQGPILLTTFPS